MSRRAESTEFSMPVLLLFVTGTAPRSQRARVNLARMLEQVGRDDIQPHEIDLLEKPKEGVKHSVFATPALMKVGQGGDVSVLYGDLSETDRLQQFLSDLNYD
ncbi:circadian clock KaiB family protein [Marinobacter persicus]|uniref:Circadian clock protein KaiB n=1 Tax=Marinobacter persicus TaxID=930118 RepID=A0A2S6G6T8_9GAMM|nr:circadian clock KaiB family protein [Marinobacter persicus]PPK51648.1 circadian clock protein KaiB [Marinobacter persicus]PPK54868.1 circadian clock protein KaiB [Marinobacter persicus]PPK58586.1 circadian clock protein KaiB [Marinobacter persicus]